MSIRDLKNALEYRLMSELNSRHSIAASSKLSTIKPDISRTHSENEFLTCRGR